MIAQITSYLGDNDTLIQRRLKEHNYQIDWLLDIDNRIKIDILAQEYKEEWYRSESRVIYNKSKKRIPLDEGKNIHLKSFYNSGEDWSILLDNDCTLHDHQDGRTVFSHMMDNPDMWKVVDVWYPIDPIKEPFNYRYKEKPKLYEENFVLERGGTSVKGSIFLVRNSEPHIYYENTFTRLEDFISLDSEFIIKCIYNHKAVYKNTNAVMRENVSAYSTVGSKTSTPKRRGETGEFSRKYLATVWKKEGILLREGLKYGRTRFDTSEFFKKHWKLPKKLIINKEGKSDLKKGITFLL